MENSGDGITKVSSISDFIFNVALISDSIKKNHKDEKLIFVYRGESMDYGKNKLMPSLFRSIDKFSVNETELKVLESIIDNGISEKNNSYLDKTIDTQHYIAYSRLLDVTFNSLVSLYFSLSSDSKDIAPRVYIIGVPNQFVFSPNSIYLNDHYLDILNKKINIIDSNFKLILSTMKNERIIAQDGGFILFPGQEHVGIPECFYKTIEIDVANRDSFLNDLTNFFNISDSKIYPEKSYRKGKIHREIDLRTIPAGCKELIELELLKERILIELRYYKYSKYDQIRLLRIKRMNIRMFNRACDMLQREHINSAELVEKINKIKLGFMMEEKTI